jgi:hypothetical protein
MFVFVSAVTESGGWHSNIHEFAGKYLLLDVA